MVVGAEPNAQSHAVSHAYQRSCRRRAPAAITSPVVSVVAIADTVVDREVLLLSQGECGTDRIEGVRCSRSWRSISRRFKVEAAVFCVDRAWIGASAGPHLAGILGNAVFERLLKLGWIKRVGASRELRTTASGTRELYRIFRYKRRHFA